MLRVPDCIAIRIRLAVPQPTEWQRIADQIKAAIIFARSDFVNMHGTPYTLAPLFLSFWPDVAAIDFCNALG
jgi:hypothetical protein